MSQSFLQVHKLVESSKVVREDWNGYNVLHDSASRVAALDIGFLKSVSAATENPKPKFVYLLGSDDFAAEDVPSDAFVVYQVGKPAFGCKQSLYPFSSSQSRVSPGGAVLLQKFG